MALLRQLCREIWGKEEMRIEMTPSALSEKLIAWFAREGVSYPWSDSRDPYTVWISETMLQQTVVRTVVPYYEAWLKRFPTLPSLAAASEEEVLRCWEGLGYYRRARYLLKTAQEVCNRLGGKLPETREALMALPGVGTYTAGAILSIAYRKPEVALEANGRRIFQRLWGGENWDREHEKKAVATLQKALPTTAPGTFNCALMQFGQRICRGRNPHCGTCSLQGWCRAFQEGCQNAIPAPLRKGLIRRETFLAIFTTGQHVLLERNVRGIGEGLYRFPQAPLKKRDELLASLPSPARFTAKLTPRKHFYTKYRDSLFPELFSIERDAPPVVQGEEYKEYRWATFPQLTSYPVLSVYRKIIEELVAHLDDALADQ